MSLKSLLSARSSSKQLSHPFAKYDTTARLSCSLCSTQIKHESLWSSHLISKLHRAKLAINTATTKPPHDSPTQDTHRDSKRVKTNTLPPDFYQDKSKQPVIPPEQGEQEDQDEQEQDLNDEVNEAEEAMPEELLQDDEWASFEAALAPSTSTLPTTATVSVQQLTTNRVSATLKAGPVVYEFGAPVVLQEGEVANDGEEDDDVEEETEEDKRERESREEREEMLERMDKEVRDQEEVDGKVLVRRPLNISTCHLSSRLRAQLNGPNYIDKLLTHSLSSVNDVTHVYPQALKHRLEGIKQKRLEKMKTK